MGVHVHLLIEGSVDERVLDIQLMDRQSVQRAGSTEYAKGGIFHHGCEGLREINPFLLLSATIDNEASLEADNMYEMLLLLLLENEVAAQDGCTPRWVRYESLESSALMAFRHSTASELSKRTEQYRPEGALCPLPVECTSHWYVCMIDRGSPVDYLCSDCH
jgi:hypothetical protein